MVKAGLRMKDIRTMVDGEVFIFNPKTTMLLDICCECAGAHNLDFDILPDGNIQVRWYKRVGMTSYLRRYKHGKLQRPDNKSRFILVNTKDVSNVLQREE